MPERGSAVETNLAEWVIAQAASVPGVEVHLDGDVSWIFTHSSAPGNTAALANFATRKKAEIRTRQILDYHLQRVASCQWIVGPSSKPAALGPILKSLGFSCRIHCAGMFCNLDNARAMGGEHPTGVTIRLAEERPFFEPVTTERRRRQLAIARGMAAHQPKRVWYFGAWMDGKAVGRTSLFAGSAAAGIYDVEVLKEARFRGVGTALVHAALQHAKTLGHSRAVLAATGAGRGVYERAGFQEVAKISFWMYGRMRQR